MGLLTGLLTLPLAPVRGTVWIAEKLEEQARAELLDETAIHSALLELDALRQTGELDEAEIAAAEDELIERLFEIRRAEGG
jgi:hypothetical protein